MTEPAPLQKYGTIFDVEKDLMHDDLYRTYLDQEARDMIEMEIDIVGAVTIDIMDPITAQFEGVKEGYVRVSYSAYGTPRGVVPQKMNEPTMNIVNQINAGLNDVRTSLVSMTTGGLPERVRSEHKAKYELDLIMNMIDESRGGIHRPWSDRKYQVTEEFS